MSAKERISCTIPFRRCGGTFVFNALHRPMDYSEQFDAALKYVIF